MCRLYSLMFFDVVMSKLRVPNEDFVLKKIENEHGYRRQEVALFAVVRLKMQFDVSLWFFVV